MSTQQRKIRKTGRLIVPCLAVVFITYFGFHAVNGSRGLHAKQNFEQRTAELELKLETLVAERKRLQQRLLLLPSHGPVVKDMLDERAREALNLTRANEIVIFDYN